MDVNTERAHEKNAREMEIAMNLFTKYRIILISILCAGMSVSVSQIPNVSVLAASIEESENEESVPIRKTDVQTASEGCVMVRVDGIFEETDAKAVLARLNEIRYEACKEGVMNPKDGEPLTVEDYVPLKWSTDLENRALTRAAEASLYADHIRPNGQSCFSLQIEGLRATNETLAWGYSDILQSIDGWYTEKETYLAQTQSAVDANDAGDTKKAGTSGEEIEPDYKNAGVTGHYVALIDPDNCYVGVADFSINGHGDACAAEFSEKAEVQEELKSTASAAFVQISEQQVNSYGRCRQEVEVQAEGLTLAQIVGSSALKPETETVYETALIYGADNSAGKYVEPVDGYVFSSSEPSVVAISEDGKTAKAQKEGLALITATVKGTALTSEKNVEVSETIAENAGWNQNEQGWQYRKASGELLTERWIKVDGSWYRLNEEGYARVGWYSEKGSWYYFDEEGVMTTGWLRDSEKWYFMSLPGGKLQTGWVESHGKWYYMNVRSGGEMQTGWLEDSGKTYYLSKDGSMVTGEQVVDGKNYTFGADGVLQQ